MVCAACWAAELVFMASAAVRFQPPAESKAHAPTPGCQKARWYGVVLSLKAYSATWVSHRDNVIGDGAAGPEAPVSG